MIRCLDHSVDELTATAVGAGALEREFVAQLCLVLRMQLATRLKIAKIKFAEISILFPFKGVTFLN